MPHWFAMFFVFVIAYSVASEPAAKDKQGPDVLTLNKFVIEHSGDSVKLDRGDRVLSIAIENPTNELMNKLFSNKEFNEIKLSGSMLTDQSIVELRNVRSTKVLEINNSCISGQIFDELRNDFVLQELILTNNPKLVLKDSHIIKLRRTKKVILANIALSREMLTSIADNMLTLESMDIKRCTIDIKDLDILNRLVSLQSIALPDTIDYNEAIISFSNLRKLKSFFIANQMPNDSGLGAITKLDGIEVVAIDGHVCSKINFPCLRQMASLTRLRMMNIELDINVARDISECQLVSDIELSNLKSISIESLREICKMPQLRKLKLRSDNLNDENLVAIEDAKMLTDLYIDSKSSSGKFLASVTKLARLQDLTIRGNGINDENVFQLQQNKRLNSLDLSGTSVTNKVLPFLNELTSLEFLDLSDTGVTTEGMNSLNSLIRLKRLSGAGFPDLDINSSLIQKLKNLE